MSKEERETTSERDNACERHRVRKRERCKSTVERDNESQ